jgi:tetratricopeptide (TPR) repeat protein
MARAFLSHSSADKARYVRTVAEKLRPISAEYDEWTFEEGMQPLEEIVRGLDSSQVFVVFLSNDALNSHWVKRELALAHNALAEHALQRIYPIIIDPTITYNDPRLPQWLKDGYNLKYVSRPVIAARRIKQRLREVAWSQHPGLMARDVIFVGRNELISDIELRVDDPDQPPPLCFIASGFPRIGRRSLLRHALIKCSLAAQSYEFPSIYLGRQDGIDDFIVKLYDLGLSNAAYPTHLMETELSDRIRIAANIVEDIQNAREFVVVQDEGCLIDYTGAPQEWFSRILDYGKDNWRPVFLIASRFRVRAEYCRRIAQVLAIPVPELSVSERNGLFKRLLKSQGIEIPVEDFKFFIGLFQGFPDQLRFTCELLKDLGISETKKRSHEITEYNSDKAATILSKYAESDEILDLLYLLSKFEFISFDFLFSLIEEARYIPLIEQLLAESVCDYVGVEREFLRLNDVIRDYIQRNRLQMPEVFQKKLQDHLDRFLQDADLEGRDVSDLLYSMKEAIKSGQVPMDAYLVPSHFLASMRELYQERGHLDRVIELADRLLAKRHILEPAIEKDVRYYLCLSLARKKDSRLVQEVQHIQGPEHNFLLGFYYRLQGRAKDAIERLSKCLGEAPVANRAKRELVQVYLSIEEYELASDLAKENYESNKKNAYHIQAYFNTLVNAAAGSQDRRMLRQLIEELRNLGTDLGEQMADIAQADFYAKVERDYTAAVDAIDDAIAKHPESHYPLISKAYLAAYNGDLVRIRDSHQKLISLSRERTISEETISRLKAYILAMEGDLQTATASADRSLVRLPQSSRESFKRKLADVHAKAKGNTEP